MDFLFVVPSICLAQDLLSDVLNDGYKNVIIFSII